MTTNLRDTISCIVLCADGSCMCRIIDGFAFLMSLPAQSASWKQQAMNEIKSISNMEISNLQVFRWFKIAIPTVEHTCTYVTSVIYHVQVAIEQKRKSVLTHGYAWLSFKELQNLYDRRAITSTIILEMFPKLANLSNFKYETFRGEISQFGFVVEVSQHSMYSKNTTQSEILINSTNVKPIQLQLHRDFFATCMPNVLMSLYHFTFLMLKFGLKGQIVQSLFRAADSANMSFISYRDFACVLAAVDPASTHSGQAAEFRKRYIFRMFDKDNDWFLNRQELEALLNFVRVSTDPDVRSCIDIMKMNSLSKKLSPNEFSRSIDNLRLKGIALVLRADKTCLSVYAENGTVAQDNFEKPTDFSTLQMQQMKGTLSHDFNGYTLGSHTLRIMKSGNVINIEDIWSIKDVCSRNTLKLAGIAQENRRLSCEINSPTVVFNELIKNLRFLTYLNKLRSGNRCNKIEEFTWGNISESLYGRRLIQTCASLKKLLSDEKRLLELKSPVYILGDIHGNYGDLAYFERILWPRCPGYCPASILCLGNYVDRVPYGIEVVSYLFCYKNLYPRKVFLLRGNHEHRKIQQKDCFFGECIAKFGHILGREVWDAVNSVFDCLPFAAVIDDKLLCVHSGIPNPNICALTKFVDNIPVPLTDPEHGSSLAWEILWNEPLKQIAGDSGQNSQSFEGFAKNLKRGTGYTFNNDALNKFLDTNFYTHLIRSNEPISSGFTFSDKGRLITIFSSSRYSNLNNDAACLMADKGTIRAIRLCVTKK